jgi:flagellar assembly protein FliH
MGRPWPLESFDTPAPEAGTAIPESVLEEERLAAFDKGYKAGWDDAAAAHAEEQGRIGTELARNLQELSFTYHEARTAMLGEMEGLLRGMVEKILPMTLRAALGELILERVEEVARSRAEFAAEIVVAPVNRELVEHLVADKVAPPLRVVEEPSLAEGQAFLRLGAAEERIDLDQTLTDIADAVSDFFHDPETHLQREASHG